jgi:predicted dienelactone hydrolase
VKAVFAMAPALVQAIEPESLKTLNPPVWILAGDADTVAPPATNARVAADQIPGARLEMLPRAGHYAFLSTCTASAIAAVPVCAQVGPQADVHGVAIKQAKQLFARYLGSP